MAQLAIKGHATRGKEVIEILEMLGGKIRRDRLAGNEVFCWYYINGNGYIDYMHYSQSHDTTVFSLEKFLEYFPYKVGDKVQHKWATSCGSVFEIEKMQWVDDHVEYTVKRLWCWNDHHTVTAEDLRPYKEETMEEIDEKAVNHVFNTEVISFDIAQRDKYELDLQGKFNVVLREGKYYVERIKPRYPNTYEECCRILNIPVNGDIIYASNWADGVECLDKHLDIIRNFQKLLICRDAYWKLAGRQIGLCKAWEPDWTISKTKFTIVECGGMVVKTADMCNKRILAFPTEEMRDAFYKNFKELIELCKELL